MIRITEDLSVFCNNKSMNILIHFYQSFNAVTDKDSVRNIAFSDGRKNGKS